MLEAKCMPKAKDMLKAKGMPKAKDVLKAKGMPKAKDMLEAKATIEAYVMLTSGVLINLMIKTKVLVEGNDKVPGKGTGKAEARAHVTA